MAWKRCGCHALPPPLCASGAPSATRLLPGWVHTSTPSRTRPDLGGAFDVVGVPPNPGSSGIRPSTATGATPSPRFGLLMLSMLSCRGGDRMVSWRSKPRVGRYVLSGACPILSVRNSGPTPQKRTLKIAMGKKSPVRFFAFGLCVADHRSRKNRYFRHAYKTPGAHNLALNTLNRDFFEFYKCLIKLHSRFRCQP